ncbi:hypothetical protein QOT17_010912 [Balamuthia mandrillaris]
MKALHLSSHQAANRPSKYARLQLPQELHRFWEGARHEIGELGDPTRVVAVDTVRFTHPEYILRTYAPQGRIGHERGGASSCHIHHCPTVPKDVDVGGDGKVVYIPGLSAPSADLTLRWLDLVGDYLNDNPLVVHDRGPEYTAHSVQDLFMEMGASTCSFPATGGAFVNPCDNPFNSQLKKLYFQERHDSYVAKLKAILHAYYCPSTESIQSYFKHVGWMGPRPSRAYVRWLLEEGYRPGKRGARLYEEMRTAYLGWKHNLRLVASNAEQHRQCSARNQTWHVWQ